jgi:hypothetical protein
MNIREFVSTAATAVNTGTLTLDVADLDEIGVAIEGTFVGTLSFEALCAGATTWAAVAVRPLAGGATVTSASAVGQWSADVACFKQVRVRMSAFTSGTATLSASGVRRW